MDNLEGDIDYNNKVGIYRTTRTDYIITEQIHIYENVPVRKRGSKNKGNYLVNANQYVNNEVGIMDINVKGGIIQNFSPSTSSYPWKSTPRKDSKIYSYDKHVASDYNNGNTKLDIDETGSGGGFIIDNANSNKYWYGENKSMLGSGYTYMDSVQTCSSIVNSTVDSCCMNSNVNKTDSNWKRRLDNNSNVISSERTDINFKTQHLKNYGNNNIRTGNGFVNSNIHFKESCTNLGIDKVRLLYFSFVYCMAL